MGQASLEVGVDEAGRGAVLGPMVMAACALSPGSASALEALGVADSKSFGAPGRAQAKRAALAGEIRLLAEWWTLRVVPVAAIDAAVARRGLNALERQVAEGLLAEAPVWARLVLDGVRLFQPLASRLPRAEARNRAETTCLSVAAASILAKAERDRLFAVIRSGYEARFGPLRGEGYPNLATGRFLESYLQAEGDLPPETRRSWAWPPVATRCSPGGLLGSIPFDFGEATPRDDG